MSTLQNILENYDSSEDEEEEEEEKGEEEGLERMGNQSFTQNTKGGGGVDEADDNIIHGSKGFGDDNDRGSVSSNEFRNPKLNPGLSRQQQQQGQIDKIPKKKPNKSGLSLNIHTLTSDAESSSPPTPSSIHSPHGYDKRSNVNNYDETHGKKVNNTDSKNDSRKQSPYDGIEKVNNDDSNHIDGVTAYPISGINMEENGGHNHMGNTGEDSQTRSEEKKKKEGTKSVYLKELLLTPQSAASSSGFELISPKSSIDSGSFQNMQQAKNFSDNVQKKPKSVSTPLPSSLAPLKTHVASYNRILFSNNFNSIVYIIPFLTKSEPETLTSSIKSVKEDIRKLAEHNDYYKKLFNASTTMIDYIGKSQTCSDIIEKINQNKIVIEENKNLQKLYKQLLVKQMMKDILQNINILSKDIEIVDRMIVNNSEDIIKGAELIKSCEEKFKIILSYGNNNNNNNNNLAHNNSNSGASGRKEFKVNKKITDIRSIHMIKTLEDKYKEKKKKIISKVSEFIKDIMTGERYSREYLGDNDILYDLIQSRRMNIQDWFSNIHVVYDEFISLKSNKSVVDKLVTFINCLYILNADQDNLINLINGNVDKVSKILQTKIQQNLGESKPPPFDFINYIVKLHLIFPFVRDSKIQSLLSIERISQMINRDIKDSSNNYREIDALIYARPKVELGWFITTQQSTGVLFNIETLFLPFIEFLRGIPVPSIVEVASKKLTKMYVGTSNKINTRLITNYVRSCEMSGNSLVDYRDPATGKIVKIYNSFEIILDTITKFLEITKIYPIMIISRSAEMSDEITFITHKSLSTVGGGHRVDIGRVDVIEGNDVRYNLKNLNIDNNLFKIFMDYCFDKEVEYNNPKEDGRSKDFQQKTDIQGKDPENSSVLDDGAFEDQVNKNSNKICLNELMSVAQIERTVHRIHSCSLLRRKLNTIITVFNEVIHNIPLDQRKGNTDVALDEVVLNYIKKGDSALCPYMIKYVDKVISLIQTIDETICYNYFKLLRDIGMAVLAYMKMKSANIVLESPPVNASDTTIAFCMRIVLVHKTLREHLSEEDINTLFNQVPRLVSFIFSRFINSTKHLNKNGAEFLRLNVKEISRLMARIGCESGALDELYSLIDARPLTD